MRTNHSSTTDTIMNTPTSTLDLSCGGRGGACRAHVSGGQAVCLGRAGGRLAVALVEHEATRHQRRGDAMGAWRRGQRCGRWCNE
jgi:hypothetical protein